MKKYLFFALCLLVSALSFAQENAAEIKKQINKIKKSQSYISAEATMPTEAEAMELANQMLVMEINDWLQSKRKSNEVQQIVLQDISTCTEKMDMKRGSQVRAFVYVKKNDIVLIKGEGQIILNENEKGTDLQPLSEITKPLNPQTSSVESLSKTANATTGNENLNKIALAKTMVEMKDVFASLKAAGAITYGEYKPDMPLADAYLLFYDREGNIRAVVQKKGDVMKEIKTAKVMTLKDFNGCAAYWFILKK